jgi:peptidoglycan hydrolase-like protein with peptidoglycan-binding domain
MIEISQRSIPPGSLPSNDVAEATEPVLAADVTQPDPWAASGGAANANPQAKFNALFGAPLRTLSLYADKNGAGGGTTTAQIGGSNPPTLKLGSRGPEVRALQHELNRWRADQWPTQKPIAEDGKFTAETKKAVEEFQKANNVQTGNRTTLDLTPNGIADARVQNRLRLENDPAFAKLDSFSKQVARDMVTNAGHEGARSEPLFALLTDPSFAKLGQQAQYSMLETLSANPRDPVPGSLSDAALVKEYTKLAAKPEFQRLDARTQATAVNLLSNIARPLAVAPGTDVARQIRTGIENLSKLAASPAFAKLPPDEQRLVLRALGREPSDTRLAGAIGSLLRSPDFERLKPEEKTAVVRQMANYPDDRSIANIERMLAKDWFVAQDLGDKQRSLKTIAYLSQHNQGDRAVIDNTIEKLLGEDSDIKLQWADLSKGSSKEGDSVTRTFGEADADTRTLILSSQKIPLGNDAVPDNKDGRHLVLHTVAHEVNHLVNNDRPRDASFQHFEIEFRAWAVGFKAEHGHYPTNKEAMDRVRQLLTEKDGAYADIKRAGGKYHDAMMIFSFVQQLTGRPVTAGNLDDILNSNPDTWINRSRDPDEQAMKQSERMAPLTDGNLDNS